MTSVFDCAVHIVNTNGTPDSSFANNGFYYSNNNLGDWDGFRQVLSVDSNSFYACGSANSSLYNYNDYYLITKFKNTNQTLTNLPIDEEETFELYPNPSSGILYIKSPIRDFSFSIIDLNGRRLNNLILIGNYASINIQDIATGTYIAQIQYADGSIARKYFCKL